MSKKKVRSLYIGIDSSLSCTGYGVIQHTKNGYKLIDYGKIIPKSDLGFEEKAEFICEGLNKILEKYDSEIVEAAIEQPNSFRNGRTVRSLCGLYGIIRYYTHLRHERTLKEINTIHAKKVVTKHGAEKREVVAEINKRFKTDFVFKNTQDKSKTDDDICDAIQIAICLAEDLKCSQK